MEGPGTRADGDEQVMTWVLLALMAAGATNAVVAVVDGVAWAWWVAALCLFGALLVGLVDFGEPDEGRPREFVGNGSREPDPRPVR